MRHRPAPALVALAVAALALGACRADGDDGDEPRTTVPTAPATTTSTAAVSYDVPATIDKAYIEKVMAALDRVFGETARYLVAKRAADQEFGRYLIATYGGESLSLTQQIWGQVINDDFRLLRANPGDARTEVRRILVAEPGCIVFEAGRDFSAVFNEPDPAGPARFVGLVPLPPGRDARGHNPTPWIITFDGGFKDGSQPTRGDACTEL